MTRKPELTLLYRIAKSYYIDKQSQSQIAEKENISRSQISRLLDKAERLGIVSISVSMPADPDLAAMADAVAKRLGLREVIVAPFDDDPRDRDAVADCIAVAAAQYLPRALRGSRIVGLGWGRTMYRTSLQLSYRNVGDELTYVPLVGLSGTSDPNLQINTIVDRVAEKHRARSHFVSVPAYRECEERLSELETQRVRTLELYWDMLDAAVIGLGDAPHTGSLFVSEINDAYDDALAKSGAVGDILSQFFRADGSVFDFERRYSTVVFNIERLKAVKRVVCLAGGAEKLEGVRAAAGLGLINTWITDSHTARMVYDNMREADSRIG